MKGLNEFSEIHLHVAPVDFRRGKDFMASLVGQMVFDGGLFGFTNRRRDRIRLFYWDETGYAQWSKWLDQDRFVWPRRRTTATLALSPDQMRWLLKGLDLDKMHGHEKTTPTLPS